MTKNNTYWLWYYGDFEIHQGMLQNFQREERGFDWPAYWYIDDCHHNVKFTNNYSLPEASTFSVQAQGIGYVSVDEHKYPFNQKIVCAKGKHNIEIYVGNPSGLPTIYITGKFIKSDNSWNCSNFVETHPAGYSVLYQDKSHDPNRIYYAKQPISPTKQQMDNGILFDFERVVNGSVKINFNIKDLTKVSLYYGESKTEALDTKDTYYKQENITRTTPVRKRAFRYIYIPNIAYGSIDLEAYHEYLPKENHAYFKCDNQTLTDIWHVSINTFDLCSNLFFIDGIKRDRWIWSGDAYQANLINQYSFFDEDISKRTILALRGQNDLKQHINTIVDYSILWLISIENHYLLSKDTEFLTAIYPRMLSMLTYLQQQTDEHGFIYGREQDWVFIDWADIDKEGATAAKQILLLRAYQTMINCSKILGLDSSAFEHDYSKLTQNIFSYFWDEQKGAFIDSYSSGKHHLSRQTNILAVIFDIVDTDKAQSILHNVLLNQKIPPITTPYFKFFEQDALCKLGQLKTVYETILNYWGGMLAEGATTFWELYDPTEKGAAKYAMYGDPYGKSLCHIWGASPIYLLSKYFIGLKPTEPGYAKFILTPHLEYFTTLNCTLPLKNGSITVHKDHGQITITTTKRGGTVQWNSKGIPLSPNKPLTLSMV